MERRICLVTGPCKPSSTNSASHPISGRRPARRANCATRQMAASNKKLRPSFANSVKFFTATDAERTATRPAVRSLNIASSHRIRAVKPCAHSKKNSRCIFISKVSFNYAMYKREQRVVAAPIYKDIVWPIKMADCCYRIEPKIDRQTPNPKVFFSISVGGLKRAIDVGPPHSPH